MKKVKLAEFKDHLSEYVKEAGAVDIVVTRHGRPAAVLIGFETEEDWIAYQAQSDPEFEQRMDEARRRYARRNMNGAQLSG